MPQPVTSKSLRTAAELTLIADIKPGFVQMTELMSYVTRLGLLLRTLFELRKRSVEQQASGYVGPLEKLRSLHFVRWSILEGRKLLLAVEFDRAWEPYIRGIVDDAGPFLDVIFCHCVGYEGHSTVDGYAKFAEWVRAHQVEVPFFYAGSPDLTVDDHRYLREVARRLDAPLPAAGLGDAKDEHARLIEELVGVGLGEPGQDGIPPRVVEQNDARLRRLERALRALLFVRGYFPGGRDEDFFDRAAFQLLEALVRGESKDDVDTLLKGMREDLAGPLKKMFDKAVQRVEIVPDAEDGLADDLQGNVLTEYSGMTHGCLAFVRFDTPAAGRALLRHLAPLVTTDAQAAATATGINVSLTMNGLMSLGLSEAELSRFPKEFRDGMEARAGLLGDLSKEHPANWSLPGGAAGPIPLGSVDLVVSVQQRRGEPGPKDHLYSDEHPLAEQVKALTTFDGVELLFVEPLVRKPKPESEQFVREHFGFADGVSQPHVHTRSGPKLAPGDAVALGELVLGYKDDRGETYPGSEAGLLRHGSYLVVRKLSQEVKAFHDFIQEHADAVEPAVLYGKLMGRGRNGEPLVGKGEPGNNDFDYSHDPHGDACPLFSHARRTNPRTPPRTGAHGRPVRSPRILRRGFSYGPVDDAVDGQRGLMFMAYNASIADQYEMVQRWMSGANSTGELGSHADPVTSHTSGQLLTVEVNGTTHRLLKRRAFVKLEWGLYLFTPSVGALRALGERTAAEDRAARELDEQALAAEGHALIQQLEALRLVSGDAAAKTAWKLVLEDRGARDKARAVWAAVRKRGGVLRTPYGVLVGSAEGVGDVLSDGERCSVREYYHRMEESVGPLYLGMDRCPVRQEGPRTPRDDRYESAVVEGSYEERARLPNRYMSGLGRLESFEQARQDALVVLNELGAGAPIDVDRSSIVDLRFFAAGAAGFLGERWFGLPYDNTQYREIFLIAAQNIFYPHPEPAVTAAAAAVPKRIEKAVEEAFASGPAMLEALEGFDDDQKKRALVGGAQGFLVATVASFLSVMNQWLESGRVHRLSQWLHGPGRALLAPAGTDVPPALVSDDSVFVRELLRALSRAPQPDLLHRRAVRAKTLSGSDVTAEAGDTVVVSLGSAVSERPDAVDLLFGGTYYPDKAGNRPQHACPGKEAAVGVMLGLAVALLSRRALKAEGVLSVSYLKP
jgi:Dyp-type peroxidase family